MTNPLLIETKAILSSLLNSKNKNLRIKGLEFVLELMSETEMNYTKAEKALKAEVNNDEKTANKIMGKILDDINKEEYS